MHNEMTTDNMSNEEVIEVLKGIVFNSFDRTTPKERQALHLAIKSLKEKPQDIPIFNREVLEQVLKYWYDHLEVGNEEQNGAVWCAINTIKYCIEHSSGDQKGGAE